MKPQFITLDGIDGAGKSTNLAVIKAWFERRGLPVLFTREPGGTPVGEALREILLNPETKAGLRAETLMMFAARMQHIEDVILPALSDGIHVVSDRFTDATFAYQGGGRGMPSEDIEILEHWVQGGLRPDLTLLLDVPLEVSMARIGQTREKDRFEQEQADFFMRVRSVYLNRAAACPERYSIIDSNRSLDEVRNNIEKVLDGHFGC
ncbi:dTMP kinase [Neisseria meningitidis]|uniref:dTMP kinase n=1 Tax=Neisseria meningitidis TaxID=487 RepID=UPI0021F1EA40|nr:dTMP kinase [Neisseria meningitidis]MCV6728882.1 dTMP kinase [Neisseria meningitidis]MCV6731043.1 dTMP kinase [Neisseria meningitidis]MCV6732512.1 dTMP kinase [Neisseria meningitidis]MCV6739327.1 dTMP kinase [Neisseria meningitidis]MCV6743452.1 dTMP kinase [Neisseria meningitidis]